MTHFEKYDALAKETGIEYLKAIIPKVSRPWVELVGEDEHLNNVTLRLWDSAAGLITLNPSVSLSFHFPWNPKVWNGKSLAERVCTLKHVATHYTNPN